ncbi:class I SAM-dependent methyltransferase [Thermoleophilum album]|uniref:Ubiquinone/menaquinone biosynthesis C-methylase UbiE n=1 Tax=Thermoleophilum album TaxID=29539 RepID=A0A1H6FIY4_THEAL|nr:class I SAM-dependent methyltransferase [Thermoleophilum album]SEH10372.1 Ubiquinone/menaquinone biosynthesis C-methylase UbiE [Thermoleophilum album]
MQPQHAQAVRQANVRYHDLAAEHYDAKWGISFDELGQSQVLAKLRRALGRREVGRFPRALEIGAGTGYFSLNLMLAGVIDRLVATDISQGMLERLERTATALGLGERVECVRCEASELPFRAGTFDLVCGHAVLHHLPDLDGAFAQFLRVLKPGGEIAFCGEPSLWGDRAASIPKRLGSRVAPIWRTLLGIPARPHNGSATDREEEFLEQLVDVHAFTPRDLRRHAEQAGFEDVRVRGEELVANWFGWTNRSLEATADPARIPRLWRLWAYHGYLALQRLDRALLEPHLPPALFYNLLIAARKPARQRAPRGSARGRARAPRDGRRSAAGSRGR